VPNLNLAKKKASTNLLNTYRNIDMDAFAYSIKEMNYDWTKIKMFVGEGGYLLHTDPDKL